MSANETYAVCLKEDNRAIGSIGLLPSAQSHTDAAEDEMEIGCSALWCGYYDGNEKSRRCQEKCGFIYHHTEENKPCDLMGDIRTEHFTRLTREEWECKNKSKEVILYIHGKGGKV